MSILKLSDCKVIDLTISKNLCMYMLKDVIFFAAKMKIRHVMMYAHNARNFDNYLAQ